MERGFRFLGVPDDQANPIHRLATRKETDWPITTWILGVRGDRTPPPSRITRLPPIAEHHYAEHSQQHNGLAIVAIVKNEGSDILEWIAYHRVVGVDHFYLYDNESNDGTAVILSTLSAAGILTATYWPSTPAENKQVSAYGDAVKRFCRQNHWVAFIDADEFIVPTEADGIPEVLAAYDDLAAIGIHWRVFGSANHELRAPGLVMDKFTRASAPDAAANRHLKTVARGPTITYANVHLTRNSGGVHTLAREPIDYETRGLLNKVTPGPLQINHYFCKSREEFEWKRSRGRAAVAPGAADEIRPESIFRSMDLNDVLETTILKFREQRN
jgi:hypothetical protein